MFFFIDCSTCANVLHQAVSFGKRVDVNQKMTQSEKLVAKHISKFVRGGCKVCDALPLLLSPMTYNFTCVRLGDKLRDLRIAAFQTKCTSEAKEEFAGYELLTKARIQNHDTFARTRHCRAFAELKFYLPQLTQNMWNNQVSVGSMGKPKSNQKNLLEVKALEILLLEQCVPIHWIARSSRTDTTNVVDDLFSPLVSYTMAKVNIRLS